MLLIADTIWIRIHTTGCVARLHIGHFQIYVIVYLPRSSVLKLRPVPRPLPRPPIMSSLLYNPPSVHQHYFSVRKSLYYQLAAPAAKKLHISQVSAEFRLELVFHFFAEVNHPPPPPPNRWPTLITPCQQLAI